MADTNNNPTSNGHVLVIPGFRGSPELTLDMSYTREGESRIIEAKDVNPLTYTELEHVFNEGYRELKRHFSNIGFQLSLAEKAFEIAKSDVLLDKYPEFMKDRPKGNDHADLRKAFMMRDKEYLEALDRINQLKAMESFVDGKIKVFENVCRFMKKKMDLIIRTGMSDSNLYITSGRK